MVAEALKGTATSAGSVFRAIAKERDLTVAQLYVLLLLSITHLQTFTADFTAIFAAIFAVVQIETRA